MHKDEKEPKETLGEKVKDKAHEIKEDLKEDAEKMKEGVKKGAHDVKEKAHELKEKAAEKMDEMKEKHKKRNTSWCFFFSYSSIKPKLSFSVAISNRRYER